MIERVVQDLIGLHATDPLTVYLQVAARVPDAHADHVEGLLYDQRRLVRVLAMRRTMFVVGADDVGMLQAATTDRLADRELRRAAAWLEADGIADDGQAWMRAAGRDTLAALAEHGPMTAMELREHVPALTTQVTINRGKRSEGVLGMSTRVLFWLATVGCLVRARPGGTISSTSWTWARTVDWLPGGPPETVDPLDAEARVVARYLAAFGPATAVDVQWWSGWTKTVATRALAAAGALAVQVATGRDDEATEAFVLPGDEQPPDPVLVGAPSGGAGSAPGSASGVGAAPDVSLLPALDATPMGWKERAWYLGGHTTFPGPLFDRSGNVGPTVWRDGEVVGAWAQRDDGRIAWRLFDGVDAAGLVPHIEPVASRLATFLGDVRVRPRFPTPWQVDLQSD